MIYHRKAADRGSADHGWLKTCHSFSFANYYDPQFMGFSNLRVINEDQVQPGKGFGTHSHENMEILSYVLRGTIEHQDSIGHKEQIKAGEFQIMSAGTGISHSEYNVSNNETLHFYQIWIIPDQQEIKPRYETRYYPREKGRQLILSPDARDDSLKIFQDMCLWRYILEADTAEIYAVSAYYRHIWIQVISGKAMINDMMIEEGDGVAVAEEDRLTINAVTDCEFLLFELT